MSEQNKREQGAKVDMMSTARDAQWSAGTFLGPGSLKLVAPAKVNLLLSIGAKRADGYHEVENVMHALALHDVVHLHTQPLAADELAHAVAGAAEAAAIMKADEEARAAAESADSSTSSSVDGPSAASVRRAVAVAERLAVGGPADNVLVDIDLSDRTGQDLTVFAADNLAFKAIDRLARAVGRTQAEKVSLRIEKHIPAQGGLGGGSSDAAAVLVGLARRWDIDVEDERLQDVARGLGADVAFFLRGGCCLLGGTGERIVRSLAPSHQAVVLVRPDAGVSTAQAYRRFDEAPCAVEPRILEAMHAAEEAAAVPLANNLTQAAEALLPELSAVRAWLTERAGVDNVLLCGSGSTTFALVESFEVASALAVEASKRGWWARPTNLSGLRAAVVPGR